MLLGEPLAVRGDIGGNKPQLPIRGRDPCFGRFHRLRRGGLFDPQVLGFAMGARGRLLEPGRRTLGRRLLRTRLLQLCVERRGLRLHWRARGDEQR